MEYICFFHPRIKGNSPNELCSACGRTFNFPEINPPTEIAGLRIEEVLGRGFYSVAYKVRKKNTGVQSVLKVTPATVYENPDPTAVSLGGYGDRRNFEAECELHREVSSIPQVAGILDWGISAVNFGTDSLLVCWSQMELIRGRTIEDFHDGPPLSPRTIAQVAEDLLSFSVQMSARGVHHNDLHGGNAVIVQLAPQEQRLRAIDPTVAVRIFDLGSAAKIDQSNEHRLGDLEQIATQMLRLLVRIEDASDFVLLPSDIRLVAQLRKVAQYYSGTDWKTRRSTATDMIDAIRRACAVAMHPQLRRAPTLKALEDHYNAQTLPAELARELIYDPEGQWTPAMSGAGPQLVVGMRGCGKTLLLRSLEWTAHGTISHSEDLKAATSRIAKHNFLGLFVSCAYLLRAPRERVGDGALLRLYLAYAREAIRAVSLCEVQELGRIDFEAVEAFSQQIGYIFSKYNPPADSITLHSIEMELSRAILSDVSESDQDKFVPLEAFTSLAQSIQMMVDLWRNRVVLFLLDDVSKRFVREEDLEDLLTQVCLKSQNFGFKVSTETQAQLLYSPSGKPALEGRDYQIFDLGAAVLQQLKGVKGIRFLDEILSRRQRLVNPMDKQTPSQILGRVRLTRIAEQIKESEKSRISNRSGRTAFQYSGLDALAALCVGDIGDVIKIYDKISKGMKTKSGSVSAQFQNEILMNESTSRLLSLVPLGGDNAWYYTHAAAFAQASHRELIKNARIREYSDVYLEIDSSNAVVFTKLMDLIDNGIYVIVGFRQRSRTVNGPVHYQFRLKFRKLLGLKFGIPLANRDRFELSERALESWLNSPSSDVLSLTSDGDSGWPIDWIPDLDDDDTSSPSGEMHVDPDVHFQPALFGNELPSDLEELSREPSTANTASCAEIPMHPDSLLWETVTLVSACGFEDRALGPWNKLRSTANRKLANAIILKYSIEGHFQEVLQLAKQVSLGVDIVDVDASTDPSDLVRGILNSIHSGSILLDVTCMTKPLIFAFVTEAIKEGRDVWILHTAAQTYDPSDEDLAPALESLNNQQFPHGLSRLDAATPGEGRSFTPLVIGRPAEDSSSRSLLVAFVTLKHKRLDSLLKVIATDEIVGIKSVHSTERGVQSRIIGLIGQYVVSSRNGDLRQTRAMEAQETYDLLIGYYHRYVLDSTYRMEIALTGTKMQTVGSAMFAAVARPACIYYAVANDRDTERFTHGIGDSKLFRLTVSSSDENQTVTV